MHFYGGAGVKVRSDLPSSDSRKLQARVLGFSPVKEYKRIAFSILIFSKISQFVLRESMSKISQLFSFEKLITVASVEVTCKQRGPTPHLELMSKLDTVLHLYTVCKQLRGCFFYQAILPDKISLLYIPLLLLLLLLLLRQTPPLPLLLLHQSPLRRNPLPFPFPFLFGGLSFFISLIVLSCASTSYIACIDYELMYYMLLQTLAISVSQV